MLLRINSPLLCLLLTTIYFLVAQISLLLAFEQGNTSPFWPPTGIAIAAILYFGYRAWPGILIGAFLTNLYAATPLVPSAGIALGNTMEALAAGYLISRFANDYPFKTTANVILFVAAVTVSTTISATIGLVSLELSGIVQAKDFSLLWSTWWIGDMVGGLVTTPLLLTWLRYPRWHPQRLYELSLLTITFLLCSALVFSEFLFASSSNYPLAFLFLPITFWAALRFGQQGATSFIALLTVIAIYGTLQGYGPFIRVSVNESLLLLQSFIAVVVLTTLILTSSADERRRADSRLLKAKHSLEQRVDRRTNALAKANRSLHDEVSQRELTSEALQTLLAATSLSSHDEFLRSSVKALAKIYNTEYAFYGVFSNSEQTTIKTLSVWAGDNFGENFQYDLEGTPCKDVLNGKIELIPNNAATLYPDDHLLIQMDIESYYGAPLLAPDKTAMGIVAVMDTEPMLLQKWVKPVLGILANRIALELKRQAADDEIKLAENVFNNSVEAIMITNADSRILRVNPAFSQITGFSSDDAIGQKIELLKSDHHDERFYTDLWRTLLRDGHWQGELWHCRKDGSNFPAWQTVSKVLDQAGNLSQLISIFSDISEKKKTEEQVYRLAHYDTLTQLPNRASFQTQLENNLQLSQRHGYKLALLFLDIDNFKLINDTSGHQAGDALLMQVAQRLSAIIRQEDAVSRLGGDEFTILLTDIHSSDDAVIVAEKILLDIETPFQLEHSEVFITTSIGISTFPNDGGDADTLLKHADAAMYRAKDKGRNNFQFFTAEMHTRAMERISLERALRKALEDDQLLLHYQPQIDITSGDLIGCEALVRWQHPERGLIPPDKFIPIAEESGLIVALGEWVINEACRQYQQWSNSNIAPTRIAVNLSGRQLIGNDLVATVTTALDTHGVDPWCLELELTESMIMEHVESTIETLLKLRTMGIYLSIDDFGTGYSSMAYLKRFPINKLKIDRSFVDDLATDPDDAAIVSATIAMGHSLNLSITAEGVETEEQLEFLRQHKCDDVQGYYFSRPLPAEDFSKLLASGEITPQA